MDHLMLFLVKRACHMCENHCFICHKKDYSTRNHPGYNCGHPASSWHANPNSSQTVHFRAVSTTPHLAPTLFHQNNLLDSFLKDITKTQGCDQVLHTLRSTFNTSLDEEGNPLANATPAAEEWNESARVLTVEAMLCVSLPNHHVSF